MWLFSRLAMFLAAGCTPNLAHAVDVTEFAGSCTSFKAGPRDLSRDCRPNMLRNIHPDGRVGFLFASQGRAISFAGPASNRTFDGWMTTQIIDRVIFHDGNDVRPMTAVGRCKYGERKPGEAYPIICDAQTNEGHFEATFIVDAANAHVQRAPSAANPASKYPRLPLRQGEYTRGKCTPSSNDEAAKQEESIGVYDVADERPPYQFISPMGDGKEGDCKIDRLNVDGNRFSGSPACKDGGMKVKYYTGRYAFSYVVLDAQTFVSHEHTYRWCSPHR